MKIKHFYYSSSFQRAFKQLSEEIQKKATKREKIFFQDPFNPSLKTHKLKGKLKNYWSFSVNYNYRIVFKFLNGNKVGFIAIGTHSIYN